MLGLVCALSGQTSDPTYEREVLPSGHIRITHYNRRLESAVIPSHMDHRSVTSIGWRAFADCKELASITIPGSVTDIGSDAFEHTAWYDHQPDGLVYAGKVAYKYKGAMPENTTITLRKGTTGIADEAFKDCTGLASITIPDSVTRIGRGAFEGCAGLASLTIPDGVTDIGWGAFEDTAWYRDQPDGLVYTGRIAYKYKGTMPDNTSLAVPAGTTGLATGVFQDCTGLTSITIPDSVTSIGARAFSGCTGLASITIPNGVTRIERSTFLHCTSLTSIAIPSSVTSIGEVPYDDPSVLDDVGAFQGCTGLTSVTISEGVTSIGFAAFYGCDSLASITIPSSVTYIGDKAFEDCQALKEVHITDVSKWVQNCHEYEDNPLWTGSAVLMLNGAPVSGEIALDDSVKRIGKCAFCGCAGLTSVTIPDSVRWIGWGAFYGCAGLTSLTIPRRVRRIEFRAFQGCTGIASLTIPLSVEEIGDYAFSGWTASQTIRLPTGRDKFWPSEWEENCSAQIVRGRMKPRDDH